MAGKPTLIGLLSLKEETPDSLLSPLLLAHMLKKGHTEHTARWLLPKSQEERHQNDIFVANKLILDFRSPSTWEINFYYLSYPVYFILLWQSKKTKSNAICNKITHIVICIFAVQFLQYFLLVPLEQADQFLTTIHWHGELGEGNA